MADETSLNFWRLFHSLLRDNSKIEEIERSKDALKWVSDNMVKIRAVCIDHELELMGVVWNFWREHKSAPSLTIVQDQVQKIDKAAPVVDALEEYIELKSSLTIYEPGDLDQVLADKTDEYELGKLNFILKRANKIANSGHEDKKTKQRLLGAKDALNYLLGQIQDGILVSSPRSGGGEIRKIAKDMNDDYDENVRLNNSGGLTIKTGIDNIDQVIGGWRKGTFWGLLGAAGGHKSTTARTIVYNAVLAGFNVVHIPLEITWQEERDIFTILHSYHPKFGGKFQISIRKYENGELSREEMEFLFKEVVDDLQNLPGSLTIRQVSDTSWNNIKADVELINLSIPVDLVCIDYLALVNKGDNNRGDERSTMNSIIKDAKNWSYTFDKGRGIVVFTPVQGNRQGKADAADNDGAWSMSGISDYSEFDKSLDGCLYIFQDENLEGQNRVKMGTAKVRRSSPVRPFEAYVSPGSRKVQNLITNSPVVETTIDDDFIADLG